MLIAILAVVSLITFLLLAAVGHLNTIAEALKSPTRPTLVK